MHDGELTWFSNHLSHSNTVHKTWHRHKESTIELTKVTKVLIGKDDNVSFKDKKIADLSPQGRSSLSLIQCLQIQYVVVYVQVNRSQVSQKDNTFNLFYQWEKCTNVGGIGRL